MEKSISGKSFEISIDPNFEIMSAKNDPLKPKERMVTNDIPFVFAPAWVTAI
jgi:hypothetical protein